MSKWMTPEELARDADAFIKLQHALLGLYAWEFFTSLGFDWDFVTGHKKFRWPMAFYFAGRYCLLFAMIGIAVVLDTKSEINCQGWYVFNQLAGNAAVGLASINLSIRTMAVWSQNRIIIGVLLIIIAGHWSLILQGVLIKAQWVPGQGCVITQTNTTVLSATFIYSMIFDFLVLGLNAYKLIGKSGLASKGSRLGKLIFADGLIFFLIAFLANLVATVFMILNLNPLMSVIFNVPAAVASTIVACRAVRRLTNFTNQGPEVFATSGHSGTQFRTNGALRTKVTPGVTSGVHVQMETITRTAEAADADIDTFKKYEDGSNSPKMISLHPASDSSSDADLEKGAVDDYNGRF